MSQNYYVYAYLNPFCPGEFISSVGIFSAKPFYIGKGKNERLYDHLKEARLTRLTKKNKNNHKLNTIREIQKLGLNPIIIKVSDRMSETDALALELKLILELKQKYGLTNIRTNTWYSNSANCKTKRKYHSTRKDTITIYNKLLKEHSIVKRSQLIIFQQVFGSSNIINTTDVKTRVGTNQQMSRKGQSNGMFGKSAVKGKKWCIVNGEEKFLSPDAIDEMIKNNYNIQYGRLTRPTGKRIIFEGELKGKYRSLLDIDQNPNRKYQFGLVWNSTKPTFLNHQQL